jgi:hypothetical protein
MSDIPQSVLDAARRLREVHDHHYSYLGSVGVGRINGEWALYAYHKVKLNRVPARLLDIKEFESVKVVHKYMGEMRLC